MTDVTVQMSEKQAWVCALVIGICLVLIGSRNAGKTIAAIFKILTMFQQYPNLSVLVVRPEWEDLRKVYDIFLQYIPMFLPEADVQATSKTPGMRIQIGEGRVDFRAYRGPEDEFRFRGASYNVIFGDDVGAYSTKQWLIDARACLRESHGIPSMVILTANPGDEASSGWLADYTWCEDFVPFAEEETGMPFVCVRMNASDNPFIDHEKWLANMKIGMKTDPLRTMRWITGQDDGQRQQYFYSACFDVHRSRVIPWSSLPKHGWRYFISGDHGSRAASCFYAVAKATTRAVGGDDTVYPANSIVLLDECHSGDPSNLDAAIGQDVTVQEFVPYVLDMCQRLGLPPIGVLDDACWSHHGHAYCIADEYISAGLRLRPASKGRLEDSCSRMRTMLANAARPGLREEAGLYYTSRCRAFELTLPTIRSDKRNPDRPSKDGGILHYENAARYALTARHPSLQLQPIV